MATPGRGVRSTRKLRQWIVEQLESREFPGLVWDDPPANTMFRIPWKHAGKQEFRQEEDAAFFKAWAIFKGKYRPGERLDPAACKTRIRCALSKSPEFEEVPSRARLAITEPYKVYRLVPLSEQRTGNSSKNSGKGKLETFSESSEDGDRSLLGSVSQVTISLSLPNMDASATSEATASSALNMAAMVPFREKMFSPQPGETAPDMNEMALHLKAETVPAEMPLARRIGEFTIHMFIFYSGVLVKNIWLPQGDFLITSATSLPGAPDIKMHRVVLPRPDGLKDPQKQKATLQVLKKLEKGVMIGSNRDGIFVQCQRKCEASICWRGLTESQAAGHLGNDNFLHVFSTKAFQAAWDQHLQGLAPKPEHQVTLCIGQPMGQNDNLAKKLIIVQMAQAFAARMNGLKEEPDLNVFSASLTFPDALA